MWGEGVFKLYGVIKGTKWQEFISIFLLEDIGEFFVDFGEFSFGLSGVLCDVGGDGHFSDAKCDRDVFELLEVKLF